MKDSSYQHVCTLILGCATLFRFIGNDVATFIVESLMHSAHVRAPDAIIAHAGYYGQAVKEISTCLATFIVPLVLNYVSSKWTLVIGSGLFAVYFASFFFISNAVYFLANVLLGIAFALIYTSYSTCQMAFSTRQTLARNSARIQAIANLSYVSAGVLYIYITMTHASDTDNTAADANYRYYSRSETRTMCGCLFAFCLINLLLTCCLPTREVKNSVASENPHQKLEFGKQLTASVSTLVHPSILVFVPRFLNHGLLVSFFMNVYPTSLQYSGILAQKYPMMTAYYSFAMCAGTTLCGIFVSYFNQHFHDFGLRPLYYISAVVQLLAYSLAVLTVPNMATAQPTANSALIEPQLLPGRAAHAYSAARFYRGIGATAIFLCSPMLTIQYHAFILISVTLLSILTFDLALDKVEKKEVKSSDQDMKGVDA